MRHAHHNHLNCIAQNGCSIDDICDDIVFLMRRNKRTFIGEEISRCRIYDKQHKNQVQIRNIGIFYQVFQKGKRCNSKGDDHKANDGVCLLIELHQPLYLFLIVICNRLIEGINNCRSHAKICQ